MRNKTLHTKSCILFICSLLLCELLATEDVAMTRGELKPSYEKSERLNQRKITIDEYVISINGFDSKSIESNRNACNIEYNGIGSIIISAYGLDSIDHFLDVHRKAWQLFNNTNVINIQIKFYEKEIKEEYKDRYKYIPGKLVFEIKSSK